MKLKLKVLWLDDSIGIALEHINVNDQGISLTPYYFWPKNDAWEQLKLEMSSREWISENQRIITLNKVSEIMTCWKKQKSFPLKNNSTRSLVQIKLSGSS